MTKSKVQMTFEAKVLGDRQIETIASTATLDRERDRILASAWKLDAYRTNPVILWSHSYHEPPIAVCRSIGVVNGQLKTVDEFPPRGVYPFADQVYDLVKAGVIKAKSVGFRPRAATPNADGGVDFTDCELLEHSYVSVPANPEALVTAKSKAYDRAALGKFLNISLDDAGEEEIFDLESIDIGIVADDISIEAGEIDLPALREAIAMTAHAAVARAMPGAAVIELDDDDVLGGLDPAAVREAIQAGVRVAAEEAISHAIRVRRGRVD